MGGQPTYLIIKFFKIYCKFWHADLENALLDGRSFIIIDLFRINLGLLISKNIDITKIKESLNKLEAAINEYSKGIEISILNCEKDIQWANKIDSINNPELIDYFTQFLQSYDLAYKVINTGEEELSNRKIQDLLVEFNNALAHFIVICKNNGEFAGKDKFLESNISRAISHLHRGILDSYKEIIHLNASLITRRDDTKHALLENETLRNYYNSTRTLEASGIGVSENNKKSILTKYKKLCKIILGTAVI